MRAHERQRVMNKICALISEGKTNQSACAKAGVDVVTLWNWRKRGENDDTKDQQYSKFLKSYMRACDLRREALYDRLNDAGIGEDGDWRAIEAYLKLELARVRAKIDKGKGDDGEKKPPSASEIVDIIN